MKQKLYKLKIWAKKNLTSQSDEEPIRKIYQKSIRWILEIFSSEPSFTTTVAKNTNKWKKIMIPLIK